MPPQALSAQPIAPLDPNADPLTSGPPRRRGYGQWVVSRMGDVRTVLLDPGTTVDLVTPKAMTHAVARQGIVVEDTLAISRIVGRAHRLPNDAERRSAIAITKRMQAALPGLDLHAAVAAAAGPGPVAVDLWDALLRPVLGRWRAEALGIDADLGQRIEDGLLRLILEMERRGLHDLAAVEPLAAEARRDLARLDGGRDKGLEAPLMHWVSPAFLAIIPLAHTSASMLAHLAEAPALQEALRARPMLREGFVREVERLHGAFRYGMRQVGPTGLDLGDARLPPHGLVVLDLSAANRDPGVWDQPDECLLDRPRTTTASFSFGPLGCTGGQLSRHFIARLLDAALGAVRVALPPEPPGRAPAQWSIIRAHPVRRLILSPL